MEFGLHLPHIGPLATRGGVLGVARAADAAGIDSLWVSDHVVVPRDYASAYPYAPSGKMWISDDAPFLEAMSTLLASRELDITLSLVAFGVLEARLKAVVETPAAGMVL